MGTTEELRSRLARVVAAGDAERRRFERELHDGAQQELIALVVGLQLARRLADSDPAAAKRLLEELSRDVHDALDGIRALASAIYPPLLASRGLADALRAAGLTVRVDDGPLERYPDEVQAGVYFFCLGLGGSVRLWSDDGALAFEVVGGGEVPVAGRDRILALGGDLSLSGERVVGTIPAQPLSAR